MREHFRGCAGVLVRGLDLLPRLAPRGGDWALETARGAVPRTLTTAEVLALLRRPRPVT